MEAVHALLEGEEAVRLRRLLRSRTFLWGVILGVLCSSIGREIPRIVPDLFAPDTGITIGPSVANGWTGFTVGDSGSIVVYDSVAGVWSSVYPSTIGPVPDLEAGPADAWLPLSTAADLEYAASLADIATITYSFERDYNTGFQSSVKPCEHSIIIRCAVGGCDGKDCTICWQCGKQVPP